MKNILHTYRPFLILLFLSGMLFTNGCRDTMNKCLRGQGAITTKRIGLYAFKNVKVRDNISLEVVNGPSFEIQVTTGENLIDELGLQIINNTLNIRNSSTCPILKAPWQPIEVRLLVPDLDTIFIENQADIANFQPFETDDLVIRISESPSRVDMQVDCDYIRLENLTGTGDIKISGYAQTADIYHAAYGTVDFRWLACEEVVINSVSSNHCYVRAGKAYLFAVLAGKGNIYYQYDPNRLDFRQEGTGQLIKIY